MAVTFSGNWAKNYKNFGINFEAKKDADLITCVISTDALQDIQPDNRMDSVEQQFLDNRLAFQNIAEILIEAGNYKDGFLYIHTQHLVV